MLSYALRINNNGKEQKLTINMNKTAERRVFEKITFFSDHGLLFSVFRFHKRDCCYDGFFAWNSCYTPLLQFSGTLI
jgi:hypothetical protein